MLPVILMAQQADVHLISDAKYREKVHSAFLNQQKLASGRDSVLFGVMNASLTKEETEGLEFLYAYMPLSDLAMNDGNYYLSQVKSALEARSFFDWGKTIPEKVFLHFVLPYRVNNEYVDTARQVFLNELRDRIKEMDMASAALEVNHWCREKVTYESTDIRTSGPLTTVRTAFGRCGEESVFTVAALRSVGIPARQVYTPRWAHTDDNHAWVEVWIDGQWKYLGACEPEPELNMGWFSAPAKRAMMTHTLVFGAYEGDEEVLVKGEQYARLNLLTHYAKTKRLTVKVLDKDVKPIADATVEFGLYNYAEFYPIAAMPTTKNGCATVTTGFGDLLIHAYWNSKSANAIARAGLTDTLTLVLKDTNDFLPGGQYIFNPPQPPKAEDAVELDMNAHRRRLSEEDSIRNSYIATFIDSVTFAQKFKDKGNDIQTLWKYIALSRGNWPEILSFIQILSPGQITPGIKLLESLSEKDFHDIQAAILMDHLQAMVSYSSLTPTISAEVYQSGLLAPRIGREFITPWRSFIQQYFDARQVESFRSNPLNIHNWITDNIITDTLHNYYGQPLPIEGMLQLGRADKYSLDLLFVAICRSFGIAGRLEPATERPQYWLNGRWHDVRQGVLAHGEPLSGTVILKNLSDDPDFVPGYYSHFTLANYQKGSFRTLDYENDQRMKNFPVSLTMDTGFYRLVTGHRGKEGEVNSEITSFKVTSGNPVEVPVRMVSAAETSRELKTMNLHSGFSLLKTNEPLKLNQFANKNGLIIIILDPETEPAKHLIKDMGKVKSTLDKWEGKTIALVAENKLTSNFDSGNIYRDLPDNSILGYDDMGEIAAAVNHASAVSNAFLLPVVVVINPNGEITWFSEGYNINTGNQIVRQLKNL